MAVTVGQNHVEIIGVKGSLVQKFLDHHRDLVAVNRRHNADALVTKMQILLVDDLRDAHRLRFQLLFRGCVSRLPFPLRARPRKCSRKARKRGGVRCFPAPFYALK